MCLFLASRSLGFSHRWRVWRSHRWRWPRKETRRAACTWRTCTAWPPQRALPAQVYYKDNSLACTKKRMRTNALSWSSSVRLNGGLNWQNFRLFTFYNKKCKSHVITHISKTDWNGNTGQLCNRGLCQTRRYLHLPKNGNSAAMPIIWRNKTLDVFNTENRKIKARL